MTDQICMWPYFTVTPRDFYPAIAPEQAFMRPVGQQQQIVGVLPSELKYEGSSNSTANFFPTCAGVHVYKSIFRV